MDYSGFRGYVFALLFYKRVNAVYLENVAALEKELSDEKFARDHRMHDFVVPEDCVWEKVARTTENALGKALNDAMIAIERANARNLTAFCPIQSLTLTPGTVCPRAS